MFVAFIVNHQTTNIIWYCYKLVILVNERESDIGKTLGSLRKNENKFGFTWATVVITLFLSHNGDRVFPFISFNTTASCLGAEFHEVAGSACYVVFRGDLWQAKCKSNKYLVTSEAHRWE